MCTARLLKIDFLFHGLTVTSHLFISNISDFPTGDVLCTCARFGRKRRKTNPEGKISRASEFRCFYGAGSGVMRFHDKLWPFVALKTRTEGRFSHFRTAESELQTRGCARLNIWSPLRPGRGTCGCMDAAGTMISHHFPDLRRKMRRPPAAAPLRHILQPVFQMGNV